MLILLRLRQLRSPREHQAVADWRSDREILLIGTALFHGHPLLLGIVLWIAFGGAVLTHSGDRILDLGFDRLGCRVLAEINVHDLGVLRAALGFEFVHTGTDDERGA